MSETPEERKEAAAIRRRWITLGELLAITAVLISALTLWNSYKERANSEAERSTETRKAEAKAHTIVLKASVGRDGDRLDLAPTDAEQVIQGQTIVFPSALALAPVETTGDARIEAGWFADALKRRATRRRRRPATCGCRWRSAPATSPATRRRATRPSTRSATAWRGASSVARRSSSRGCRWRGAWTRTVRARRWMRRGGASSSPERGGLPAISRRSLRA